MNWKAVAIASSGLLCACAPAAPPAQPPPSVEPAAAATPPPAPAATETHLITIRTLRCADLLNAATDDRAAGSMFLLGYEAARLGIRSIDVAYVEGMETAALDYCTAHPARPAIDAFSGVFGSRK